MRLVVNLMMWNRLTLGARAVRNFDLKYFIKLETFSELPCGGWLGGGIIWSWESVSVLLKRGNSPTCGDMGESEPPNIRFKCWSGIFSIGAESTADSISASRPIDRSAGSRSRIRAKRPFLSGKVVYEKLKREQKWLSWPCSKPPTKRTIFRE